MSELISRSALMDTIENLTVTVDRLELDRQDMAMLIRRLMRKVPYSHNGTILRANEKLIAQTKDYLERKGLTGSILRKGSL